MRARDHNKTFVLIYTFFGVYVSVPLLAAPWAIISNLNSFSSPTSGTQVIIATITAIIIFLSLAVLFFSTAYSLYKRKQRARRMALISAIAVFRYARLLQFMPGGSCIATLLVTCTLPKISEDSLLSIIKIL